MHFQNKQVALPVQQPHPIYHIFVGDYLNNIHVLVQKHGYGQDNSVCKYGIATGSSLHRSQGRSYHCQLPFNVHSHGSAYRGYLCIKLFEAIKDLPQPLPFGFDRHNNFSWLDNSDQSYQMMLIHQRFSNSKRRGHPWKIYLLNTSPRLDCKAEPIGLYLELKESGGVEHSCTGYLAK